MRKLYLDNIRWATVLVVIVYHVFYLFNACGVFGGVGSFAPVQYQDAFLYFVYPWFMVLLFLIAGMCARYSLEKYSAKDFIKMRTRTLLVPSTIGLFVFYWLVGLLNIKAGGGFEQMKFLPKIALYFISVASGIGPLWFAQMLWLFSIILPVIKKLDKNDLFYNFCKKSNYAVIILLVLILWGTSQILNAPVITVYRFGIYFASYLIGYFVLSHDEVQDKIQKMHIPFLALAVATGCVYVWYYFGQNYTDNSVLKSLFTNVYCWAMCLAILGCAKTWFDKQGKFARYMTKANFGFYVLHIFCETGIAYLLKTYSALPPVAIYIFTLFSGLLGTAILYEVLKRIPFVRYTVLGIKIKKRQRIRNLKK